MSAPAPTAARRWRGDTLALRLFVLMWVALVLSHLVAWSVVRLLATPVPGGPPGQVMREAHRPPGPPPPREHPGERALERPSVRPPGRPGDHPGRPPEPLPVPTFPSLPPTPGLQGDGPGPSPSLPPALLALDYGLRFFVIALAAWWGSRWLARPVARLVQAAEGLGPALARGRMPPPLDEHSGTAEVRSAATVFNRMALQLRQVFEARGLMMAAISHDLRTPLTRLRMRLETTPLEPQFQRRSVADLAEMNALIDAVLEVFRGGGEAALHRVDVAALVQALVDDHAEQGARITLGAPQGEPLVLHTEALALRRIVDNLAGNALRYAGQAELSARREGAEVVVTVQDSGPGIPHDALEAVMQPFVRLESSRNRATGGAGLGLFIARELAQRLGGRLTLANRPEGGLRAELRLPAEGPGAAPR